MITAFCCLFGGWLKFFSLAICLPQLPGLRFAVWEGKKILLSFLTGHITLMWNIFIQEYLLSPWSSEVASAERWPKRKSPMFPAPSLLAPQGRELQLLERDFAFAAEGLGYWHWISLSVPFFSTPGVLDCLLEWIWWKINKDEHQPQLKLFTLFTSKWFLRLCAVIKPF